MPFTELAEIMAIEDPIKRAEELELFNERLSTPLVPLQPEPREEGYQPPAGAYLDLPPEAIAQLERTKGTREQISGEKLDELARRMQKWQTYMSPEKVMEARKSFIENWLGGASEEQLKQEGYEAFGPEPAGRARGLVPTIPAAGAGAQPPMSPEAEAKMARLKTRAARSGPISKKGLMKVGEELGAQRGRLGRLVELEEKAELPKPDYEGEFAPETQEVLGGVERLDDITSLAAWKDEYQELLKKPNKTDLDLARMKELTVKVQGVTDKLKAGKELELKTEAYQTELANLEAEQAKARKTRKERMDKAIGKLESIEQAIDKAEIQPDRLVKDMPTWRFVLGLLAGGLAQFAGFRRGDKKAQNTFVTMLDKAVKRDIAAQRANLEKLGKRATIQTNIISRLRDFFTDTDVQDRAAKVLVLEKLGRGLDLMATKYKGTQIEGNIRAVQNQIYQEQKKSTRDFMLKVDDQSRKLLEAETRAYSARQQAAYNWAQLAELKKRGGAEKRRLMSEKTAKELGAWESTFAVVVSLGDAHRELKTTGGVGHIIARRIPGWLGATHAANFDRKVAPILADIIRSFSGAQVTDKERKWFEKMMPVASDTEETGQKKIAAMLAFLGRKHGGILKGLSKAEFHLGGFIPLEAEITGEQGAPTY